MLTIFSLAERVSARRTLFFFLYDNGAANRNQDTDHYWVILKLLALTIHAWSPMVSMILHLLLK
jgi:hypothetical protein